MQSVQLVADLFAVSTVLIKSIYPFSEKNNPFIHVSIRCPRKFDLSLRVFFSCYL